MKLVTMSLAVFSLAACSHNPPQPTRADALPSITHEPPIPRAPNPATSDISGPGGIKGSMIITNEGKNAHIVAEFTGLSPNSQHGIHIHQNGSCDGEGFQAAGGHFNPWKTQHGGVGTKMREAGDLGNIKADTNGYAKLDLKVQTSSSIGVFGGKSVIVHERRDDLETKPSGKSGDRIACGLIVEKM